MSDPASSSAAAAPHPPRRRQAVLVIHGIGSQRPMETLGAFVDAVWLKTAGGTPREGRRAWYRPDTTSTNFDLFQIVADEKERARTDFFELYWAHLMEGTRFVSVWQWFWNDLVKRRSSDMPQPMREAKRVVVAILVLVMGVFASALCVGAGFALDNLPHPWALGLALGAAVLALGQVWAGWRLVPALPAAIAFAYPIFVEPGWLHASGRLAAIWFGVAAAAALILLWIERRYVSPIIGDAARYLRNTPENIAARQAIRAEGVAALERLHASERDYERIVVVGHSLGSIIGYDVLRYAFASRMRDVSLDASDVPPAILALETAATALIKATESASPSPSEPPARAVHDARAAYMAAQAGVRRAIGRRGARRDWIVSDFVTLGSPLAYANILLAGSQDQFEDRVRRRLAPVSPPQRDAGLNEDIARGFYSWRNPTDGKSMLTAHHGAVFALTRWTNLFVPASLVVFGDIVGGPVGRPDLMGVGVKDVAIDCGHLFGRRIFSHTSYWRTGAERGSPTHIEAIQLAMDLDETGSAAGMPERTSQLARNRLLRRLAP